MKGLMEKLRRLVFTLALGASAVLAACSSADAAPVVTPAVDVEEYIVAATTALGVVVAAAVLAFAGFLVIRKGIRWFRTIG